MTQANGPGVSSSGDAGDCSVDEVALAILRYASDFFEEEINPEEIDRDMSLLNSKGTILGSRTLNSLDSLSLFLAIEDELGVPLMDIDDIDKIDSLEKISRYLIDAAEQDHLRRYCHRWLNPR